MPHRLRFDPKRPLVVARDFTFMGTAYKAGDPFAPEGAADRLRARQYEARVVNHGPDEAAVQADADPVRMTESDKRHTYLITAPWLDEPISVRGKANAEKRLAEVQADGPPVGYVDGGSEVTVEEGGGGWFTITAPGQEPEKVQGREAAEARFLELHEAATAAPDAPDAPEAADPPADDPDAPDAPAGGEGEGTSTEGEASTETSTEESDMINDDKRPPEDGDKPNEPGTNQPNGAEVINDQKAADPGNARSDTDGTDGDDDGDDSAGSVGP